MAKQQTEEELNIKRRARRRLIGSIALALAVVVILPMVLDSEPKPSGQDIELRIPNADKAGDFIPGIAPSAVNEVTSLDEQNVPVDASSVAAATTESAVKSVATVAAVTSNKPTTIAKPVAVIPPPIIAAPAKDKPVISADGAYLLQVGAFANAATAANEADKLKAWGFKAYTEQISGTTRVRVGPYGDRSKADQVRILLEKHGLHPVIKTAE
ncbi:MAG: hypothetical protein COZ77_06010 [Gallionellales bacterium CG_4_8_14_3_um_filter_54_18]|nr:MAG: hypothetical protein COZ77_06010 [Gallionellales bacterium CG_4_8_14_3_um_filter_54_18]